jgi:capsule polysaccharide export protein KpsE/RkpR
MALNEYERSNNFAVLQEESTVEASYLAKLKTELSDYQLEMQTARGHGTGCRFGRRLVRHQCQ